MATVQFKAGAARSSFRGPKYGVKDEWRAGESRDLDDATAELLVEKYPDYFEVQSAAAAGPSVDRAVKAPAKKAPAKKAAPKPKAKRTTRTSKATK